MHTVTASFNTTMRQMTEMSQRKKSLVVTKSHKPTGHSEKHSSSGAILKYAVVLELMSFTKPAWDQYVSEGITRNLWPSDMTITIWKSAEHVGLQNSSSRYKHTVKRTVDLLLLGFDKLAKITQEKATSKHTVTLFKKFDKPISRIYPYRRRRNELPLVRRELFNIITSDNNRAADGASGPTKSDLSIV